MTAPGQTTTDCPVGFPTGPDDVDTIRLTWMPSGAVEWMRGGERRDTPRGTRRVKVEYWLADRFIDMPTRFSQGVRLGPVDPAAPDMTEEHACFPGGAVHTNPRVKLTGTPE